MRKLAEMAIPETLSQASAIGAALMGLSKKTDDWDKIERLYFVQVGYLAARNELTLLQESIDHLRKQKEVWERLYVQAGKECGMQILT